MLKGPRHEPSARRRESTALHYTRSRVLAALSIVMLIGVAVLAARAEDDTVNERPSASAQERERHWGVDCSELRREVLAGAAGSAMRGDDWIGRLRLCAAIYNVPGDARAQQCPDYAGAADALAVGGADLDTRLRNTLRCRQ